MKTIGPTIASVLVLAGVVACMACSNDEPKAEKSSGGENAFDRAERNANEAQQDFQKEFKETGDFIDEKANKAAQEARKGARKVGDALSDEDAEPEPGKP